MSRAAIGISAALLLAGCGGEGSPTATAEAGSQRPALYDVDRCIDQTIPGTGGLTVGTAVTPDTVTLNFALPSAFPNGRQLSDPVIDTELAWLFLDLVKTGTNAFVSRPINPPANDLPFRTVFPYLAAAQGNPPLSETTGTTFNFRTDPASAYVRVDRMGVPAVATALVAPAGKTAFNDASPIDDAAGTFLLAVKVRLVDLTNALEDDVTALGLAGCATRVG